MDQPEPENMKFLIIDTYYQKFLDALYSKISDLHLKDFESQKKVLFDQCFGTSNFYSANLINLGYEATEVIANADMLQAMWCLENGGMTAARSMWARIKQKFSIDQNAAQQSSRLDILKRQVRNAKPDVLYFQDLSICPPGMLSELKNDCRLIVGQIACPLPPHEYLRSYDLLVTSLPNYLEQFRSMGMPASYLPLGFEPRILSLVGRQRKLYDCTFVGGITPWHSTATSMLEEAAKRVHIDFFGYGSETLSPASPIRTTHHGEVWGLDMYRVLMQSKVTINRHIGISGRYANNMRLYEATGCGAMLLTDQKDNLKDLFQVGKEVVAYENLDELCSLIAHYRKQPEEREGVAMSGQDRTLRTHTYQTRMEELIKIVKAYV